MATELYEFVASGNHQGEHWSNVLYIQGDNLSAGDVIASAEDLLDSWMTNIHTLFLDMLPATCWVNRYTAKRQAAAGGIQIVRQFDPMVEIGTGGATAASMQLCPIVRLIPPMGVKSAGRFFLAAISEDDILNNKPVAGWNTKLGTLMTALLADFGTGSIQWQIAVYSRKLNQYNLALAYDTSPIVGWQRGRQRPF